MSEDMDQLTEDEIEAWRALVLKNDPVTLNARDIDKIIATNYLIMSSIFTTQELISAIIVKINETGEVRGDDIKEKIVKSGNESKKVLAYCNHIMQNFLQKGHLS
ncbi:hypothetical protein [Methylobacterium sp. Leaf108]|uniref:hypothetical protein n=1 Tax=Methylobacterium sp. Leaf108 TaxID=1736256 RepID=UPI000A4BC1D1|nr:hypothetical protein [Methylobacterium sp. Leaf108]